MSGTPLRLTSIKEYPSPAALVRCSRRAVSSSRWTRVISIRRVCPFTSMSR